MKNYPDLDADSERGQNPGPLPLDKLGDEPLGKDDKRDSLVKHLQKMLFELGYLLGLGSTMLGTRVIDGVDGVFGGDTDAAVRQFQKDHKDWDGKNLDSDGKVGERTADALNREMVGIWYDFYQSKDKDGALVPTDVPLLTIDTDTPMKLTVPLDGGVTRIRVVVHGQGTPPKIGPDRSVNYIPNDPLSAGSSVPDPVPRFLAKEVHLMHLHSANTVPTWAIRLNGSSNPVGGDPFLPTTPDPDAPIPQPGRDPSANTLPDAAGFPGKGNGGRGFQEGQVHVAIARTVRTWLSCGMRFNKWAVAGDLGVTVRDSATQLNGFYSRGLGGLFLGTDTSLNPQFFAVDSPDLVSHEIGHAVLDANAPDLLTNANVETRSFHEAFGDMSAILTTIADPDVREEMLSATGGDIAQSNLVSRVMEDLGARIFASFAPNGAQFTEQDSLREAFKENPEKNPFPGFGAPDTFPFSYNDPANAPPPPASPLSQPAIDSGQDFSNTITTEIHNFGRVFVMAFYDSLINAFNRLKDEHGSSEDDIDLALREAAGCLGKILSKAIQRQPTSAGRYYQRVAREMFRVDQQLFKGEFRQDLRGNPVPGNGFVGRNIVSDDDIK